jgi:hypothetical protein
MVSCIFYAGLKCRETLEEKEDAQWHAFIIHIRIADTTVVPATTVLHRSLLFLLNCEGLFGFLDVNVKL